MMDYSETPTADLEAKLYILEQTARRAVTNDDLHAAWSCAHVAEEIRRELKRRKVEEH